ncbi:nucleotidyltransferase family protein [Massilia sp. RP-1-19]|uniref:Nucleotidyltransferase family protein n=1 Tax=Massilia polaris TaxID=2728846 RepID=A0A848HJP9_9BURK|nr:nucleotidyltransferase family protein [Massilia polaris]NML60359.1 nucleotidyltransferase family protein [Massilia polaris]
MNATPILLHILRDPAQAPSLTDADWDLLVRQAASARLDATVQSLLDERGMLASVPPQVQVHFEWARTYADRHRKAVHWEVRQIRAALEGLGLPLILLKGGAYAAAGLPAARGRVFTDIDILVPKERLDVVEAALMMHGWHAVHQDDYDQRYYRNWMHELPPMQHVKRATSIDVHHAILPLTARARPDSRLLREAAVAAGEDPALQVLAPADMILHSATHLFYGEFDNSLRDLVDIHRLLQEFGSRPGFWRELDARARSLELGRPLFYALRYAVRLLGTPVPAQALRASAAWAPGRALLALIDALMVRGLMPPHASCRLPGTGAALLALYVRSNWLRMPPLLLARHLFHKAFLSPQPG